MTSSPNNDFIKYVIRITLFFIVGVIFIILFIISMPSCSPNITANTDSNTTVKETIVEKYRDTIIYVKLPSDVTERYTKDTMSFLETKTAKSEASISSGILYHKLEENGNLTPVEYKEKIIERVKDSIVFVDRVNTEYVEKELNLWQKIVQVSGYVFFVVILSCILKFVLKIIRK